ncbi:MAG: biotin/lipoyl-binding protein, partial [Pedobacter sp.]
MGRISNNLAQLKNWEELSVHANSKIIDAKGPKRLGRIMLFILGFFIILLFLPYRQTIPGKGTVTALRPEDRPQTVQNQIGGRIEHWAVREGQEVEKGDTILVISETSQSYFDPELPTRLNEQLDAKRGSETAAVQKIDATKAQMNAMTDGLHLQMKAAENKVRQARNYVSIDSAELLAVQKFYETTKVRLERYETGYKNGLFSLTDIETRRLKLQEDNAKVITQQNKLSNATQNLLNSTIE